MKDNMTFSITTANIDDFMKETGELSKMVTIEYLHYHDGNLSNAIKTYKATFNVVLML